jgi:cholinesterase
MFQMLKDISPPDMHRMNLCFTCVAMYTANERYNYNVSTWRYRYFGDWDNVRMGPGAGAFHGSELSMVFGNKKRFEPEVPSTPDQLQVEKMLMATVSIIRSLLS